MTRSLLVERGELHDNFGSGVSEATIARPLQAAAASASATSFAAGAALRLLVVVLVTGNALPVAGALAALVALDLLGGLAAWTGGARLLPSIVRITSWSALAMAITFAVGRLFGHTG